MNRESTLDVLKKAGVSLTKAFGKDHQANQKVFYAIRYIYENHETTVKALAAKKAAKGKK